MLKQHKVTGKKYLCYHNGTVDSCYKYTGSGTYWQNHIRKHGKKISTIILVETDDKEKIKIEGLRYSDLWNVVESDEFANLVREDGSGGHEAMQAQDVRRRAAESLKRTWKDDSKNKKLKQGIQITSERRKSGQYTSKEREAYEKRGRAQAGKTMVERLNNPNYCDPRRGKTAREIYGETYNGPWNKGINMKDKYGSNYVDPKSKPFKIISHMGEKTYNSESEFITQENFSAPVLTKLKQTGSYKVKRQSNTKHNYAHGEVIIFEFI